ncbi:hypothetical protein BC831DRAFT_547026 [Entophlyctis helioformis]|nr:hypothetical protein BC831DRAFT_547026 [Entophlyctis helioformis]
MSSDEIIRHIIKDITSRSGSILKLRRTKAEQQLQLQLQHMQLQTPPQAAPSFSSPSPSQPQQSPEPSQPFQQPDSNADANAHPPDGQPNAEPGGSGGGSGDAASLPISQLPPLPNDSQSAKQDAADGQQQPAATRPDEQHPPPGSAMPTLDNFTLMPPRTPLPEAARNIFLAGIQSHVPPFHVTETLAAFLIRAVVLDPHNGFRIEHELSREEVDRLISLCVDKITTQDDPVQETVRMQVYFDTNFPAQNDFLHKEKLTRIDACSVLLREILDVKSKSLSAYEALYRKIVSYVLLRTHVGNATEVRVVREATAALESVFPQSELNAFMSLARGDKEAQLNGLAQLVTGIRLFNKQLGKGGETIENLPELCATELREITILLHDHTQKTEQLVQQYKAVLDYADMTPNSEVSGELADRIRNALVFRRQYLIYLDALQDQVTKARQLLISIGEKFDESMRTLKVTCKSKTAVPVDQVYPHFITLSNLWSNWTDELFLLAFRRGIVDQLHYFARSFNVEIMPIVNALSDRFRADIEPEILPESEVIAKSALTMTAVAMINKTVEVVHPGNTTQYYKLPVEYGGFCPFSLVSRRGLIVPGDKNLGMVRFKDRLFAFASLDCIVDFCRAPDRYMEIIIEMAKEQPALVQLLHLYNYFPTVEALERARSYTRQRLLGQMPMVAEIGCQVDTHIVDAHLAIKYRWNEWDLRRQALMLVNLKDKRTHSTQSDLSHFRRESETQYYQPKDGSVQTKRTSNTSVPRSVVYYAGLRNSGTAVPNGMYDGTFTRKKPHFRAVNLTIDHDGGPVPYGGGAFGKPVMPPIAPSESDKGGPRASVGGEGAAGHGRARPSIGGRTVSFAAGKPPTRRSTYAEERIVSGAQTASSTGTGSSSQGSDSMSGLSTTDSSMSTSATSSMPSQDTDQLALRRAS